MEKSKITIEYDDCMKEKHVQKKVKRSGGNGYILDREVIQVKDPKCWEVITVTNCMTFTPGYRLNKKQVEALCRNPKYDVQIGLPGQFRVTNSKY